MEVTVTFGMERPAEAMSLLTQSVATNESFREKLAGHSLRLTGSAGTRPLRKKHIRDGAMGWLSAAALASHMIAVFSSGSGPSPYRRGLGQEGKGLTSIDVDSAGNDMKTGGP